MNSLQRFLQSMCAGQLSRPPLFEEGIRDEVLEAWRTQGLAEAADLQGIFHYDQREEISLDVDPHANLVDLAERRDGLERLQRKLETNEAARLPEGWRKQSKAWRDRQHVLMLTVHEGFFESLGIQDARTFTRLIYLLADQPDFVREVMRLLGELSARLTERLLQETSIDAAVFSEPIAGNHGPLVSPRTYAEFVLPTYQPVLDVLHRHKVETIILRTYANTRSLLPVIFKGGFNCLWACEVEPQAMDYLALRKQFGPGLRLIGGIDTDVLYQGKHAIRQELERVLPPLLAQGGFIPLADGRVRQLVPYENYAYYRRVLEEMVGGE